MLPASLSGKNRAPYSDNGINFESGQLSRDLRVEFRTSLPPPALDCDRASISPTKLAQPLHEKLDPISVGRIDRAQLHPG